MTRWSAPCKSGPTAVCRENAAAWLTLTARNLALDQLRREQNWRSKEVGISAEHERWLSAAPAGYAAPATHAEYVDAIAVGPFKDDTLRLLYVCFHP